MSGVCMAGDFACLNEGQKSLQDRQVFNLYSRLFPYNIQDSRHIMDCAICHQFINQLLLNILNVLLAHVHTCSAPGVPSLNADPASLSILSAAQSMLGTLNTNPVMSPVFTPMLQAATPAFLIPGANADIKTMNQLKEGQVVTSSPINTYTKRQPIGIQFAMAGADPVSIMRQDDAAPFLNETI